MYEAAANGEPCLVNSGLVGPNGNNNASICENHVRGTLSFTIKNFVRPWFHLLISSLEKAFKFICKQCMPELFNWSINEVAIFVDSANCGIDNRSCKYTG